MFQSLRALNKVKTDTTETEKFCRTFDKFFDIFNIRSIDEANSKKKSDLKPIYSSTDDHLQVAK